MDFHEIALFNLPGSLRLSKGGVNHESSCWSNVGGGLIAVPAFAQKTAADRLQAATEDLSEMMNAGGQRDSARLAEPSDVRRCYSEPEEGGIRGRRPVRKRIFHLP